MKYLAIMAFFGLLTTGCVHGARDLSPNCIKLTTGMGWEMQAGCNTKKKPNIMVNAEWKLK